MLGQPPNFLRHHRADVGIGRTQVQGIAHHVRVLVVHAERAEGVQVPDQLANVLLDHGEIGPGAGIDADVDRRPAGVESPNISVALQEGDWVAPPDHPAAGADFLRARGQPASAPATGEVESVAMMNTSRVESGSHFIRRVSNRTGRDQGSHPVGEDGMGTHEQARAGRLYHR